MSKRDPKQEAPPEFGDEVLIDPQTFRRAPSYRGFMVAGALIALIAAWVVSRFGDPTEFLDANGMGWVLTAILVPFGILFGGVVALILDRVSLRKLAKRQAAARSDVDAPSNS